MPLAFSSRAASVPNEADEASAIGIYLLTVGLGESIEARYGHTILSVVDRKAKASHNYNWGMFSFSEPNFVLNFFLGKLRYWVADEPYVPMLQRYRYWEKRPVLGNTVNLTPAQTAELLRLIARNLEPGQQYFWYQYFYKNCATIPRDHLDATLGGRLKQRFSQEFTDVTFRDYVRGNLNRPPIVAFLLDILMNSRLDHPLSKWDEMFYPPKLRAYLSDFPALDDQGQEQGEQKLLSDTQVLVDLDDVPSASWRLHPWFLGLGLLSLLLCWALTWRKRRKASASQTYELSRWCALPVLFWGFFSGVLGSVMLVSWVFSGHLDLHHNANLWVFWPIDWILLPVAWRLAFARAFSEKNPASRWARRWTLLTLWLSYAHCACIILWFLGYSFGFIEQNTLWVQLYLAPVALAVYATLGFSASRSLRPPLSKG